MTVYLLISGECEYDAHESLLAVCESVEIAKVRAQRILDERWDSLDRLPNRQGLPERRYDLRWIEDSNGEWLARGSSPYMDVRIEAHEVESSPAPTSGGSGQAGGEAG